MNQYLLAGALAIIAGFMMLYKCYKLHKVKKGRIIQMVSLTAGVCMLALGCIGIYKNALDGINVLLFGIVWFDHMRKSDKPCGGVLVNMHYRGWIAAVFAIIAGNIIILQDLHILE